LIFNELSLKLFVPVSGGDELREGNLVEKGDWWTKEGELIYLMELIMCVPCLGATLK